MIGLIIVLLVLWYLFYLRTKGASQCGRVVIVRYYSPRCGYCVSSQAEWDSFKSLAAAENLKIKIVDVNTTEDNSTVRHWLSKHQVDGVPSVVKFAGDEKTVYNGPRTCTGYMEFARG